MFKNILINARKLTVILFIWNRNAFNLLGKARANYSQIFISQVIFIQDKPGPQGQFFNLVSYFHNVILQYTFIITGTLLAFLLVL